jgi:hypothetical protein
MDEEQESEDVAVGHLQKHIDALEPDVYAIHLSLEGDLLSVSTDPKDDETTCIYYPPFGSTRAGPALPECRPCFVYAVRERNRTKNSRLQVLPPPPVPPQSVARDELVDAASSTSEPGAVRPTCARRATWPCCRLHKPLYPWRHDRREPLPYV